MLLRKKLADLKDTFYLVQGKDNTGLRTYYLLKLDKRVLPRLKKRLGQPHLDLREFGEIVASGYGEVPENLRHIAN